MQQDGRLNRGDGIALAWTRLPGSLPMVVFLPGFGSDKRGSKAQAIQAFCEHTGRALLLLDYSGHGESDGRFEDGTIGIWTEDARCVIEELAGPRLILIGSSMGGWIGLLLALGLGERIAAFIGIAAAPDFTETLIWDCMSPPDRARLLRDGQLETPSSYGPPLVITQALIEDGRRHRLLAAPIALACPVRLLQGMDDPDVPWRTALALMEAIEAQDIQLNLIKDGDHRLSRGQDIALLLSTLSALLGRPLFSQDGSEA